jgi:uncharacterized pyridoxamine 5'-phosphate oxidase family protein
MAYIVAEKSPRVKSLFSNDDQNIFHVFGFPVAP